MNEVALVVNMVSTAVMVGVIWFVQVVHYPLLARFGAAQSVEVAHEHQRRTAYVVMVPMTTEGVSTLALLAWRPASVAVLWPWLGAVLLAVALGSTVLLSVPLHSRMAEHHSADVGRRLVTTNWPRTVAWTLRMVVCVVMLGEVLAS